MDTFVSKNIVQKVAMFKPIHEVVKSPPMEFVCLSLKTCHVHFSDEAVEKRSLGEHYGNGLLH